MTGYVGRAITLLALCCAIGLHWIALQSVAWTAMLIENTRHTPLRVAMAQTFDGAHPCSICHAVSKGKSSEKKSDLQLPTQKIDMICAFRVTSPALPFVPFEYLTQNFPISERGHSPLVPPAPVLTELTHASSAALAL
jgi:hypothetical protein